MFSYFKSYSWILSAVFHAKERSSKARMKYHYLFSASPNWENYSVRLIVKFLFSSLFATLGSTDIAEKKKEKKLLYDNKFS